MNTKLTLSLDKSVIERAKDFAQQKGLSLSALIENYLKVATSQSETEAVEEVQISPTVAALRGSVKLPEGFDGDYKALINQYRDEKWGA